MTILAMLITRQATRRSHFVLTSIIYRYQLTRLHGSPWGILAIVL